MKSVIITGADGFIGSHLSKFLTAHGYKVYAVVIKDSPIKYRLSGDENIKIIEGDLASYKDIAQELPLSSEAFLHLAWAGVTPDQRNDLEYQMQNVALSANAVRLAAEVRAEKFIFPGSTMEYIYYGKPIDKNAIPSPQNAYGAAKISARYSCSVLCRQLSLPFIYCVISGIYSEDRNDNNVIYYTIDKLLKGEKPSLTKLEQLWDYVHIDDVAKALRLVIEKGKADAFYSIGHGDNRPLSDYIYQIRDIINPELPLGIGEIPYADDKMPCSCVNLQPIYKDTGFIPEVSFESGISRVINKVRMQKFGGGSE